MSERLLVAIPLCDYESISTTVWSQRTTYYLVRACLRSFAAQVRTPATVYVLADRCSDPFVQMAEEALKRFGPRIVDNSTVGYGLEQAPLPDTYRHVINQFFRMIELADGYDFAYFCEQDYLFRTDALEHALLAFDEIPAVNLLSPFDHPDRHRPDREPEYGRHRYFKTERTTWKSVSSTNGNFMWRMRFVKGKWPWLEHAYRTAVDGRLDFHITNALYRDGELLLCPVRSLVQHYRLDGTNTSPTFGFSARIAGTKPVGCAVARIRRLLSSASRE